MFHGLLVTALDYQRLVVGSNSDWSAGARSPLVPNSSPGVGSPLVRIQDLIPGGREVLNVSNIRIEMILFDLYYFGTFRY